MDLNFKSQVPNYLEFFPSHYPEMYLFTAKAQKTQRVNYFLIFRQRPEIKKNQIYKVKFIARATIFVTYVKLKLFSEKVLLYSLVSLLSAGIFGGPTAKNKKKNPCALRVSACPMKSLLHLFHRGGENNLISWMC
jgi:uncharacterized membrane protein